MKQYIGQEIAMDHVLNSYIPAERRSLNMVQRVYLVIVIKLEIKEKILSNCETLVRDVVNGFNLQCEL